MKYFSAQSAISVKNVHVVSVGNYGRAVVRQLRRFCPELIELEWTGNRHPEPGSWPESDVQVIASWRIAPSVCQYLDEQAYQQKRPLIPLFVESSALCLGPIIVPGKSACWHCWEQRIQQHTEFRKQRAVLIQFYEENPDIGPRGYWEPFALIGAARIAQAIGSFATLENMAGHIWQMDLFTKEVSIGHLIGVDGCPRCGLDRPLSTRTYAQMKAELNFLWQQDDRNNSRIPL